MSQTDLPTVEASEAARALLQEIKSRHGDNLLFHQSGGCCDGSAPMCFQAEDFIIGDRDVLLGDLDGVPFYIQRQQGERWGNSHLIIDAIAGNGGMFSLDNGTGKRFLTRTEACIRSEA